MLIVEFSVNFMGIDMLEIQRVDETKSGLNIYAVVKPKGFEDLRISHRYDKGYFELVLKTMKLLQKNGYNPKPPQSWKELRGYK
jgi:hypothetical protein